MKELSPFFSWWKCQNISCSHSILNYVSKEHPVPTIFYVKASHQDKFMQEQTGNKAGPKKRRTDETKKIHAVYNRKNGKWERCQKTVSRNTSYHWEEQNHVVERKKDSSMWRWKTKGRTQPTHHIHSVSSPYRSQFLVFLRVAHFLWVYVLVHSVVPSSFPSHLPNWLSSP